MEPFSGTAIRARFLEYFHSRGHEIVPSAPLVPPDDPSLLFTNAGMVQFKNVFLGAEKRSYARAVSCQKCVRAGGKHNDLENVGYTARHHTFFEMLGNFSFGDYFKPEAIGYAWEFLTRELALPVDRLWVTIYQEDSDAAGLWKSVAGVAPDRVVRLGAKDNFWAMGDTGPCGPCSEILIDQGPEVGCRRPDCRVGCDCDRYLELWNLVFMEFFRDETGVLRPLPRKNIDTGMGLERIAAVCQGKTTNFESDLFSGLLTHIGDQAGFRYGLDGRLDVAMRVIADHARAAAFLVADGVLPSNEGRGYVLRRILRRAARFGRVLGLKGPFLGSAGQVVALEMGGVYPELEKAAAVMAKVMGHEETRFAETLEFGLRILEEELPGFRRDHGGVIPGAFIFKLYDTYGFPVDILQDVAREEGLELDRPGFEQAMAEQRERSRRAHQETLTEELPLVYRKLLQEGRGTCFVGYATTTHVSRVLALLREGATADKAPAGWSGELVAAETPFYAEAGGQVGDKGWVTGPAGKAQVLDTVRRGDLIVHRVTVTEGCISPGEAVTLDVLEGTRIETARNHTATHLLHAALKSVLGDHVKQAGSLVDPARLRFDFTHFGAVTQDELTRVEDLVNAQIRADRNVQTETVPLKEALACGATALFGEKYGETVRMVRVPEFSLELCGGTHLQRTGQIGLCKIASESSVASGVRRIEALTGQAALDLVHAMEAELGELARRLRCPLHEISGRIARLQEHAKTLEKEIQQVKTARTEQGFEDLASLVRETAGVKVLAAPIEAADARTLRETGDRLKERLGSAVVVLAAAPEGKALLLATVTKDLTSRIHAGNLIKSIARIVGGTGGGRADMAQAGGPDTGRIPEALESAYDLVRQILGEK